MFALDLQSPHLYIINSMSMSSKSIEHYSQVFKHVIDAIYSDNEHQAASTSTLPTTMVRHVPPQTNSNDCGLCVCLNLAAIAESAGACLYDGRSFGYKFDSAGTFSRAARKLVSLQIV